MYLKSVEIHGFKSFANKILLEFESGITGIVGPNGSGKSNVADAVRWVLGEQSAKQLRGSKMEDVIFAGTQARKPQGFAFVALTMDNSDHTLPVEFEEVKVSRRVYRSGESEYQINGTSCRLKDVQELFLDTGVGKEGYSIIGQGQIEKILSGRPEERRELFDEAVGITKYKKRKNEAVRNLAAEHDNLNRVNDIIAELEKQKGPLEAQSENALKYLEYREILKKYETEYFVEDYDHTEEIKKKAENDCAIAENNLTEAANEALEIKKEYESIEKQLEENETAINDTQQNISTLKLAGAELNNTVKITEEQIHSIKSLNEHFDERINETSAKLETAKKRIEENETKHSELSYEKEGHTASLRKLAEALEAKKEDLDKLQINKTETEAEFVRFEKRKAEASGKIDFYKNILEQNKIKKLEITNRMLRQSEQKEDLAKKQAEIEKKISMLSASYEKVRASILSFNESRKDYLKEREQLVKHHDEKQREYLREKTRYEALTNQAERYNGYGSTVRNVMEHSKVESGILGTVADIVHAEKKYETAIETALGGAIQQIVTDKEDTAKRTITWLKQNKLGRATFLPLDSVGVHSPGNFGGALNEKGIVGVAALLVTFEDRFAAVVTHLLGRTLVATDMDTATTIARKYHYSLRIVTLDGEQLNPGGSISGGAFKNSSNLLGRNREIEELKAKVARLDEAVKECVKEIKELDRRAGEQEKSAGVYKEEINKLTIEIQTEKNRGVQLADRISENENLIAEIRLDLTNADKEKTAAETALATLQDKLTSGNDVPKGNREEVLKKADELILTKTAEISDLNDEISAERLKEASAIEHISFNESEHERLEAEYSEIKTEYEKIVESNDNYAEELAKKQEIIAKTNEEIKKNTEDIESAETHFRNLTEEKQRINADHKQFFTKREEISDRKNRLDVEIVRLKAQIEKAENDLVSMVDYMRDEYDLTYSEIVKNKTQSDEEKVSQFALKKLIVNQKNLIKGLGNVNVNAIDEYRELNERYTLMHEQQEDIIKAEDSLKDIIEDLDGKMRAQFTERFKKINEEFNEVFIELFGGGKGRLELVDGEDILEAGIKISAQPPGKKLQNMMQLSGGEKSLTAIALLFAIQNLKPSPFCLLDEIEAALDDSNVGRFAGYLHKLTDHTQFIVITHRRGTMNAADRLYGITMQEKGVSTMVSVDLVESELTG